MTDTAEVTHHRDMAMGRLEGRVSSLEERVTRFEVQAERRLEAIDTKLDAIADMLAGWSGARKLAAWLAGGAAVLSAWALHVIFPNFPR